jgi:hypothetical protein
VDLQDHAEAGHELPELVRYDPALVGAIYVAVFGYDETRRDPAAMSRSRILSLVSDIRQDYESAKWQLGEFFPRYLEHAPLDAIRALLQVLDTLVAAKEPAASEQRFDFDGMLVAIRDDRNQMWDWDWEELSRTDPVVKMLNGFQQYLEDRAAEDDRRFLQEAVRVIAGTNRSSTIWGRLLASGADHPTSLGVLLAPLAWATPILAGLASTSAARPFVHAVFPVLDAAGRARVERAILALPAAAPERDRHWITEDRNRLLEGLDRAQVTTDEARVLLRELDAEQRVPGTAPAPPPDDLSDVEVLSTERHLRAAGVDLTTEENHRLLDRIRPVETFLEGTPADQDSSVDIVASLQSLLAALTAPTTDRLDPAVSTR